MTYLLGTMVHILLKAEPTPDDLNHNIRIALSPATSSELTLQFKERFGIRLIEGYGSTETNFVMSNVLGGYVPGALGRVVKGFEARVVDDQDCDVPDGTPGELIIRQHEPYSMSNGYFGNPDATVNSWRNLWFHTGDRVVRDEYGIYRFCDRLKDCIRRSGENISSLEVEAALYAHPEIEKAAVIGVPSEASEEEVMAYIVPRAGSTIDPRSLIDFLKDRIAYFAIPRYIEIVDELPETENGKIKKFLLKERGVTQTTWDRESAGIRLNGS